MTLAELFEIDEVNLMELILALLQTSQPKHTLLSSKDLDKVLTDLQQGKIAEFQAKGYVYLYGIVLVAGWIVVAWSLAGVITWVAAVYVFAALFGIITEGKISGIR